MSKSQIELIASKHLGKAGDGSVVNPYITPDRVDATLLVGIPRYLNRTHYNIENTGPGSVGIDVWNAYEVSYLLSNGYPVSCFVRIVYDSTSENIVESKSIKLYLNSFNMMRIETLDIGESIDIVKNKIAEDLTPVLGVVPVVGVHLGYSRVKESTLGYFTQLENAIDHAALTFDQVNEDPEILKPFDFTQLAVQTSLLRSNCRVTNQPDWGDVYIAMDAEFVPTYESLAQYIVSMRKENHFHEEICECIFKRLSDKYKPQNLVVACFYTRRGGIDINPVRYTSEEYFKQFFVDFASTDVTFKTLRQ
jgi:7-cyano-7-deazaguanine reductase